MTTRTRARLIATLLGLILLATGIVAVVLHRGSMNGADADGTDGYDPTSYDIQIRYDPANDQIHGHTTITARATDDLTRFGLDLKLPASRVTVDGQPAAIAQKAGKLSITPSATVPEGHAMTVTVDYAGTPSALAPDPGMRAAWIRTGGGVLAGGEPDGAPWWYPSNDDPSNKATFTITVTVPAGLQAISNGALLGGPHTAAPGWGGAGKKPTRWPPTSRSSRSVTTTSSPPTPPSAPP
jgi:aminopeptidase N